MPESQADGVLIRKIGEQLFDTWKEKHDLDRRARDLDQQGKRFGGGALPAWIACALSIAGIILLAGGTNEKVNRNTDEIATLKQSDREQDRQSTEVLQRLATIETLLRGDERRDIR